MIGLALLTFIVVFIIDSSVTLLGTHLPHGLGYWVSITGILLSIGGSVVAAVYDF